MAGRLGSEVRETMNMIAFVPQPAADASDSYHEVEILIDGLDLIERIRAVEG